ncbi:dynactin subunit 4-like [Eupeodes corollae]|uniref:dynactin subunit 4-like n=1 Tax=Eupeodes corollae TaxID=290404 RepID=UPI0024935F0A|nr:dynactin subunit 4-like [Eupeodes corollae]XP_055919439.1 dynactin subunit 4-like [Eupeodes corollae]XP_055919440.1 dynactin subunit 4-like [Eupeodes corollae]XP_055919441.1 dynactin subunit 4-like [Eupeodes corollae]
MKINFFIVTTIQKRQPFTLNNLYSQRKRSLRCRQCEHNVIKPEYHPGSIKYHIQLLANYHVPDVLLVRCEKPLKPGTSTELILKLTNPTMYHMTTTIMKLPTKEDERRMIYFEKKFNERNQISPLGESPIK